MRVLIGGGSGFIGSALRSRLEEHGDEVVLLSRDAGPNRIVWDEVTPEHLHSFEAVVNLAGEPVLGGRWSGRKKRSIVESRLRTTATLQSAIVRSSKPPKAFINASAVGWYPLGSDATLSEETPPGEHFLAQVCQQWEKEAQLPSTCPTRLAIVRIGMVLGRSGGALPSLIRLFHWGIGGKLGKGKQAMPWIHIEDLIRLFIELLDNPNAQGVFNGVAPDLIDNEQFTRALARELSRPAFCRVPSLLLQALLGQQAKEVLLDGARVAPKRVEEMDFQWHFPTIEEALKDLID